MIPCSGRSTAVVASSDAIRIALLILAITLAALDARLSADPRAVCRRAGDHAGRGAPLPGPLLPVVCRDVYRRRSRPDPGAERLAAECVLLELRHRPSPLRLADGSVGWAADADDLCAGLVAVHRLDRSG